MDYKKRYNEALEKAKRWADGTLQPERTTPKGVCELIFPELAESEDERILVRLIEYFQGFLEGYEDCYKDGGCVKWEGLDVKSILAWLEKQKDERELGYIEGKVEGVRQTCQEIKDAMSLFEPKDLTPFEFTFRDYIDSAIRYCLSGEGYQQYIKEWSADLLNLEKQKEQKPTDYPYLPGWRKNRDDNKPKLKRSVLMLTTHGVAEGEWLGEKWCQYRWSCELKDDEVLYWMHLSDLEQLEKEGEEKQKEQKPAEWSEEDEAMLESIIEDYNYLCKIWLQDYEKRLGATHSGARSDTREQITWLKSLRPSWKPSEEQKEALEYVIRDYREDSCNATANYLQEILDHLKTM